MPPSGRSRPLRPVLILMSQVKTLLLLPVSGSSDTLPEYVVTLAFAAHSRWQTPIPVVESMCTLALGSAMVVYLCVVGPLLVRRGLLPVWMPQQLVVVAGSASFVFAFKLHERIDLPLIGTLPHDVPPFAVPQLARLWRPTSSGEATGASSATICWCAFLAAVVGFMESYAVARKFREMPELCLRPEELEAKSNVTGAPSVSFTGAGCRPPAATHDGNAGALDLQSNRDGSTPRPVQSVRQDEEGSAHRQVQPQTVPANGSDPDQESVTTTNVPPDDPTFTTANTVGSPIDVGPSASSDQSWLWRFDPSANAEFLRLGFSNLVGSFFGSYPVTGGISRTAVLAQLRPSTPLNLLFTAVYALLVVVVLNRYDAFYYLPKVTLSAIVASACVRMVDVDALRHAWRRRHADGGCELLLCLIAGGCTLFFGVEWVLLVGPLGGAGYVAHWLWLARHHGAFTEPPRSG